MNEYVVQFINRIREQIKRWKAEKIVAREELLRFLRSAARTATIIGRDDIEAKAHQLFNELEGQLQQKWTVKKAYESLRSGLERFHELSCIAMLDLNHFKKVNDRFGHLGGDIVLQEFARFLCRKTRTGDTVVRFGGEEFIVLLTKTAARDALRVIERLRNDLSAHLIQTDGQQISCTFSGGIVEINDPSKPLEY